MTISTDMDRQHEGPTAAEADPASPPPAEGGVALSLWHLFALTAAVAAVFALERAFSAPLARGVESSLFMHHIVRTVPVLLSGLMLGGLAIVVIERLRGRIVLTKPGHAFTLAVWHLLVLTAGVAGVFGLWRVLSDGMWGGVDTFFFDEHPLVNAISLTLYGLMLGGAVIGVVAWLRTRAFPIEPGYALVLLGSLQFVHLLIGFRETAYWSGKEYDWWAFPVWFGVRGWVAIACAWLAAPRLYWQIFFLLWGLDVSLVLLGGVNATDVEWLWRELAWWRGWSPIVAAIALGAAGLADLRREPRPDWLHWFGLGTLLAFEIALAVGRGIFV